MQEIFLCKAQKYIRNHMTSYNNNNWQKYYLHRLAIYLQKVLLIKDACRVNEFMT